MQRISIVGNSGSGKTTLGRKLAEILEAPFLELDSLYHQPGWSPIEESDFAAQVSEFILRDRWVIDGNYAIARNLVWEKAEAVVWFDWPRHVIMRRVVIRTLRRGVTREELWNGNREPLSNFYRLRPEKNIITWAWTNHHKYADRYSSAARDPRFAHLRFIRLASNQDIDRLLDEFATPPNRPQLHT